MGIGLIFQESNSNAKEVRDILFSQINLQLIFFISLIFPEIEGDGQTLVWGAATLATAELKF